MTDFHSDLMAKAYALLDDKLDVEDFKTWLRTELAAGRAKSIDPIPPPRQNRREFNDYAASTLDEDQDWENHRRAMLGSGEME